MNKIKTLIAAAACLAPLAACTPEQIAVVEHAYNARTATPAGHGTFHFDVSCDDISITVGGYEPGTVFFVNTDGSPPYHMTMAEGTHDFQKSVRVYGIYIRNPEGTVLAETFNENPCTMPGTTRG